MCAGRVFTQPRPKAEARRLEFAARNRTVEARPTERQFPVAAGQSLGTKDRFAGRSFGARGIASKLMPMNRSCPQCQGPGESSLHGGLFVDRCAACGWEQSGTANSPEWFRGYAVEVESEFWVRVSLRPALTPAQLRAIRAADPDGSNESAQSFVTRMKSAPELRLGPFWPKPRALAALRTLADAGLEASIDV